MSASLVCITFISFCFLLFPGVDSLPTHLRSVFFSSSFCLFLPSPSIHFSDFSCISPIVLTLFAHFCSFFHSLVSSTLEASSFYQYINSLSSLSNTEFQLLPLSTLSKREITPPPPQALKRNYRNALHLDKLRFNLTVTLYVIQQLTYNNMTQKRKSCGKILH